MTTAAAPTPPSGTAERRHPVDQVPPVGRLSVLSLQHVLAFYAGAVIVPLAIILEDMGPDFAAVQWAPQFIAALAWAVLGVSIGAIFLLFALIRRSDATQVTSLLYLTPPTTALMAWLMFGEAFNALGMAGMALAVAAVFFVVSKSK